MIIRNCKMNVEQLDGWKARTMTSTDHSSPALVRDLTDRNDIAAVLYRVARAMDSRDWGLLESSYTADAVGDYTTSQEDGAAAILAAAERFLTPFDATQHLLGNVEITIDGDVATTHATFIAQHVREQAEGSGRFVLGGDYDDTLVRTPYGWKIARRSIRGIWGDGDASVLQNPLT